MGSKFGTTLGSDFEMALDSTTYSLSQRLNTSHSDPQLWHVIHDGKQLGLLVLSRHSRETWDNHRVAESPLEKALRLFHRQPYHASPSLSPLAYRLGLRPTGISVS